MKKILVACLFVLLISTPAFALFENGGFENGTLSGWNVRYGTLSGFNSTDPYLGVNWSSVRSDQPQAGVIDNNFTMTGLTLNIDPYAGNKMALLNNYYGLYHATEIWQQDVITQADIDNGAKLYVDWGAVLEDPNHGRGDDPFFGVTVTIGGTEVRRVYLDSDNRNVSGSGWVSAGGYAASSFYKAGQWEFDLSGYAAGTGVRVDMFVSDCGRGGHSGYAFLDGIGTIKPPDPGKVPEPATMLLLGLGLAGLAGAKRRFKK